MVGGRVAGERGPDSGRAIGGRGGDAEHQRMLFSIARGNQRGDDAVGSVSGELSEYVAAIEEGWERFYGIRGYGRTELDATRDGYGNDGEYALSGIWGLEP